jgi:outer membrane lipoprotein-sorting protein
MTLLRRCLLCATLALVSGTGFAGGGPPEPAPAPAPAAAPKPAAPPVVSTVPPAAVTKLLDAIQAKYGPVSVLRGSITQTTGSPVYGTQVQKGTVVLQRPGKMRWEFEDKREYVSDGSTMWIYTPADKQVIRIKDFGAQAATADAVLQSMHKLRELFDVTVISSDPKIGHELLLAPKAGQDAQFKTLGLKLDPKLVFDEVRITDPFDTVTVMDFTSVELGGAVAPGVFTFQIPEGVQVIDAGS